MPQQDNEKKQQPNQPQGQDVTAGKGRRDEVGKSGIYPGSGPFPEDDVPILTPADINSPHERPGPGVERNEELEGSERMPRKGNEMDKPDSDRLAD